VRSRLLGLGFADFDVDALRALLGRTPPHRYTRNTIASLTGLARACKRVRAAGFALDDGEYMEEVRCVAAPIRDASKRIVAGISIASTVPYMPLEKMAELIPLIKGVTARLSAELGLKV